MWLGQPTKPDGNARIVVFQEDCRIDDEQFSLSHINMTTTATLYLLRPPAAGFDRWSLVLIFYLTNITAVLGASKFSTNILSWIDLWCRRPMQLHNHASSSATMPTFYKCLEKRRVMLSECSLIGQYMPEWATSTPNMFISMFLLEIQTLPYVCWLREAMTGWPGTQTHRNVKLKTSK